MLVMIYNIDINIISNNSVTLTKDHRFNIVIVQHSVCNEVYNDHLQVEFHQYKLNPFILVPSPPPPAPKNCWGRENWYLINLSGFLDSFAKDFLGRTLESRRALV